MLTHLLSKIYIHYMTSCLIKTNNSNIENQISKIIKFLRSTASIVICICHILFIVHNLYLTGLHHIYHDIIRESYLHYYFLYVCTL